jgi:hypothetical protein
MRIKTMIRAGSGGGANSGGVNAGGASGGGHNSSETEVQVEPVTPPPPPVYYPPGTRCAGL